MVMLVILVLEVVGDGDVGEGFGSGESNLACNGGCDSFGFGGCVSGDWRYHNLVSKDGKGAEGEEGEMDILRRHLLRRRHYPLRRDIDGKMVFPH